MKKCDDSSKKPSRKTIEKNRRNHMKGLCCKLTSLVPSLSSPSRSYQLFFTQESLYDESVTYIKQLEKRIDGLKEKRDEASRSVKNSDGDGCPDQPTLSCDGVQLPTVNIKEFDGGLQVSLSIRSKKNFRFSEVVKIIEDAGGEAVKGGYTTVRDKVFYTLHVQARVARIGVEITSIQKKLHELINQSL